MVQSSVGTMMHASSHWLVNSDVMSGLRAVGLQSDAFGNGAQALNYADDFFGDLRTCGRDGRRPAGDVSTPSKTKPDCAYEGVVSDV